MSADGLRVAIVIPAYQAAEHIEKVLGGIPPWVDAIYVVDDASSDKTGARAREVADPRVHVLVHEVNRGVGDAMITGYHQALRDRIDVCIKMDADDQMDPAYLTELIEPITSGRADYAKGNRFHNADALRSMPTARRVGNAALSFLIKASSGQWHVFDPTNGYTAIHRTALAALDSRRLHPRYFFECSMLAELKTIGAVVQDVPIPARYGAERSNLSITTTVTEFPWLLLRQGVRRILWQYFVADFNAVSLFLLAGVPLIVFGFVFGFYHWTKSYRTHVVASTGTVMLAALPFILGFQLLLQALVLDIQNVVQEPRQGRRDREPFRSDDRPAAPSHRDP